MTMGRGLRKLFIWLLVLASAYGLLAYIVLPQLWSHYEHQPGLAQHPAVTTTTAGIPGGPLNVGLVGGKTDVLIAMQRAGWFPADPITLMSSLEIAGSVVLDLPDPDAPVSTLLYEGRTSPSRNRSATALTGATMSDSGWC